MQTKEARIVLVEDYGEICFLGGIITPKNPLTVHHMVPVRAGGRTVLVNLALLCRLQHDMFNVIENHCPTKAEEINDYFRYFKETRDILAMLQMKNYVHSEVRELGYVVETQGHLLTLHNRTGIVGHKKNRT